MPNSLDQDGAALPLPFSAPQHRPRPLPIFLDLVREQTARQPERLARTLAGLRRYQEAKRPRPRAVMPAIATRLGASLRDYGGTGPNLLFVPSLINPPTVLDLGRRSLLRWLARRGRRVLLLDWGDTEPQRQQMSVASHVEDILLPLMRSLGTPPDLAGYCLGGTMAVAGAQLGQARSLALIAAPWSFAGFPSGERAQLAELWRRNQRFAERFGLLPMEVLQTAFWSLDPGRTVAKFERLADSPESDVAGFVALEDWANDGPPLSVAAARELFEAFFAANQPGCGLWQVGGQAIDPAALPCPILNIVSSTDRIVPSASAAAVGEHLTLAGGHVGMVVGSRARQELWEPLAGWLSRVSPTC